MSNNEVSLHPIIDAYNQVIDELRQLAADRQTSFLITVLERQKEIVLAACPPERSPDSFVYPPREPGSKA